MRATTFNLTLMWYCNDENAMDKETFCSFTRIDTSFVVSFYQSTTV